MKKTEFVLLLRSIGCHERANEVLSYKDKNGRDYGWNGNFNKKK